jgi:hypothetical protein
VCSFTLVNQSFHLNLPGQCWMDEAQSCPMNTTSVQFMIDIFAHASCKTGTTQSASFLPFVRSTLNSEVAYSCYVIVYVGMNIMKEMLGLRLH